MIRRWVLDPNNEVFVIRKAKEKVVPTEIGRFQGPGAGKDLMEIKAARQVGIPKMSLTCWAGTCCTRVLMCSMSPVSVSSLP